MKCKSLIPDKNADDDLFVPKPTSKPAAKKPAAPKPLAAKRAKKGEPWYYVPCNLHRYYVPCALHRYVPCALHRYYHVLWTGIMYLVICTGIMYHVLCKGIVYHVLCTGIVYQVFCTGIVYHALHRYHVSCFAQVSCILLCTGIMYRALFTVIMYHALCSGTHAGPPAAAWCWCPHLLTLFLLACIFCL